MSNILLVPIHLDALVLDEDEMVVEAIADFSRLPYCDGKQDVNPDVANVSEEIVSQPFENRNLPLKAGIHLHWSLPDALTKSRRSPDNPSTQEFPPVPNRWLVTRCNASGDAEKEWIIESDYLYPPGGEDQFGKSVVIPYRQGHPQPFRYLGRSMELSASSPDERVDYYPKLTAVGYGEPTFAAFYPNCHSVFGFYDPDYPAKPDGRRYDVIGWYSDPGQDLLNAFKKAHTNKANDVESLVSALKDELGWTLTPSQTEDFPVTMLCYASLLLGEEAKDPSDDKPFTIAVGNTGTEALSSYLATTINSNAKKTIEDQLEALQLSAGLEHRQLDVGPKFLEARHEKGFTAISGGSLWNIRPETNSTSAADAADATLEITLPDEMADLLNVANDRQQEYDRAWQEIESMRRQLFSDWYKYMLCSYPPEDSRDEYPNIDEVQSYMDANVDSLQNRIALAGTLALKNEKGKVKASADGSLSDSQAATLATAINNLQASVDSHNEELEDTSLAYRLKQISAPRYWRPTEPVVLIEGSIVKPSERHGQDGRAGDSLLETQILTDANMAELKADDNLRRRIRERIAEIGSRSDENFAFSTWTTQPWNPFLLEWEVEAFPIENKSNLDPATGRYHEDFIRDNYELDENQVDFTLRPDGGAPTSAACVYSGRSILTPYAGTQLTKQVEAYLNKEVLAQYYETNHVPTGQRGTAYLEQHIDDIQRWYEDANDSSLKALKSKDEDPSYTAIRAWKVLNGLNCLSQSLGGFNEALLMHKQTMQLHISDPLCFDPEYQEFAARVSDAVNDSIYSAPEPLNDFNPIRSGAMKILQLRLVDTFGQVKELVVTTVITSEPMNISDKLHARLAPRLSQPARINFRWLAAESDEQEMNDHPATTPICGWLLTNNLDNRLMFYDGRGKALGSLVMKDTDPVQPTWEPAPGGGADAAANIDEIQNPHLKKMVASIQKCGPDFLTDFITAVDNALENIEPENFAQHQDIALLMGHPLALVRASLNLELQGLPAVHQGWNELRQDMQRETRDDNGFSQVRFPIRIGEYKQFNDGTVGYWKEKKDGGYEGDVFYAPQSDDEVEIKDSHLKTHRTDPMTVFQTVESEPQILSLLLDPRGVVHATSGILPAKAISIPPDQYAAALEAIEITFLSTPILTDVGKIHLPLPTEAGYRWSWLQQDGRGAWTEISSRGVVQKNAFAGFKNDADVIWNELIKQGWIAIDPKEPAKASVTAKDRRKNQTLAENLKDKIGEIEDILDRAHIGPISLDAKFSGPQEIREGWLKLSVDDDSPI